MDVYPEYINRMLQQAHTLFKDENYAVSEAAGICYDVLALFPDCTEASDLILTGFSQPWLIRDTRRAISRLIDEWDDRPYQQRHRLALSFSYFSQSDHWKIDIEDENDEKVADVLHILKEGDRQLLQAYLSGIDRATDVAWAIFQEGIRRAKNPREVILWVANNYAHRGFFGDAVDILETAQPGLPDDETRRLWVEVRWWRDHQHQIPWLPPEGDGSRYEKYLAKYDPERLAFEKSARPLSRQYRPPDLSKLPANFVIPQPISEDLEAQIDRIMRASPPAPSQEVVDWSYLTQLESGEVDISQFPRWARELLEEIDDPELRAQCAADFLERFSNPETFPEDETDDDEM
jgi:hypothetical protein